MIQSLRTQFYGPGHVEPFVLGSAVTLLGSTLLRIDPMTAIKHD